VTEAAALIRTSPGQPTATDARTQLQRLDGRSGPSSQDVDPAALDAERVVAAALDEDPLAVRERQQPRRQTRVPSPGRGSLLRAPAQAPRGTR
jgi:hypothetical protein